jgi:hypothetical protein
VTSGFCRPAAGIRFVLIKFLHDVVVVTVVIVVVVVVVYAQREFHAIPHHKFLIIAGGPVFFWTSQ